MCVSDVEYSMKLEEKIHELRAELETNGNTFNLVLTYPELAQWCAVNLPGSSVHLLDGEVIIHTGLTVEMNGELMALEDLEETCPSEGDIPIQFCTCGG